EVGHADAPDALHDQVRAAVVGADVVDRRYARVLQPGGDARLADEPPDQLLVPLAGREADELDRHLAFQPDVPAGPDLARPGAGQRERLELVPAVDEGRHRASRYVAPPRAPLRRRRRCRVRSAPTAS